MAVKTPRRAKAGNTSNGVKRKARPKAMEAVGGLSQKRLLYLAKISSPPAISNEPADLELGVRRPTGRD